MLEFIGCENLTYKLPGYIKYTFKSSERRFIFSLLPEFIVIASAMEKSRLPIFIRFITISRRFNFIRCILQFWDLSEIFEFSGAMRSL